MNEKTKPILDQLARRIVKAHAAAAMLVPAERLFTELTTSVDAANGASASARTQVCELRTLVDKATEHAARLTATSDSGERTIADADQRIRQLGSRIVRSHESFAALRESEDRAIKAAARVQGAADFGESVRVSLQATVDQLGRASTRLDESAEVACRMADTLDGRSAEVETQSAETIKQLREMLEAAETRTRALAEAEARVKKTATDLARREVELNARAEIAAQRVIKAEVSADRLGALLRQADDRVAQLSVAERSVTQAIQTWESGLRDRTAETEERVRQADGIIDSVRSGIQRGGCGAVESSIREMRVPEARTAMAQFSRRLRVLQETAVSKPV